MLSREISLKKSPKFSIGCRHFEQVLNGEAAKRGVIPSKRCCPGKRVCTRAHDRSSTLCFQPERVPNADDSERENEEANDRLEGTFWCTCERCKTMPTQRKCVCCREQPESENKMQGTILS